MGTHPAMFIDPKAELGATISPVMLSPPLPANENPPLATMGGRSSVKLAAPVPSWRCPHETLTTTLFRIDNSRCANFQAARFSAYPFQSPLKSNVAGETY